MSRSILTTREGSALITTLLFVSLTMLVAFGVAQLLVGDIRIAGQFEQEGKALYMAEAGLERGLLELKANLPGYEPKEKIESDSSILFPSSLRYEVDVQSKSTDIPHVMDNGKATITERRDAYDVLDLQRSVAIPLFYVDDDGKAKPVKDFLVQYFVDFSLNIPGVDLQDLDLLRWKIVGMRDGRPESISDFTAAAKFANAGNPICFGTSSNLQDESFIKRCIRDVQPESKSETSLDGYAVKKVHCQWNQARSHYRYVTNPTFNTLELLEEDCYKIKDFLDTHEQSYLILTNLINRDLVDASYSSVREALSKVYYRVLTSEPVLRDKVVIKSDGFSGNYKKSLDLSIGGDRFLPVFNFSIYRTDTEKPDTP